MQRNVVSTPQNPYDFTTSSTHSNAAVTFRKFSTVRDAYLPPPHCWEIPEGHSCIGVGRRGCEILGVLSGGYDIPLHWWSPASLFYTILICVWNDYIKFWSFTQKACQWGREGGRGAWVTNLSLFFERYYDLPLNLITRSYLFLSYSM